MQIETGAFIRLRGYKIELIVRDTSIREFPPAIFNTLTGVSFLSLSLINNLLETFQPFSYTKPPVLNQHGTILHDLQLMVGENIELMRGNKNCFKFVLKKLYLGKSYCL